MAGGVEASTGGLDRLRLTLDEHLAELDLDLARHHVTLHEELAAGRWARVARLLRVLASDPACHVAAALEGWERPASREWAALADLWDLTVGIWSGKGSRPPTYPRPWPTVRPMGVPDTPEVNAMQDRLLANAGRPPQSAT